MELSLQPRKADTTVFEGEGGVYYVWTASKTPAVVEAGAGVAAGRLVLHPQGFALPHYSDTCKIGYVVQGSCTIGLLSPDKPDEEKVMSINEGDVVPIPIGAISWWFNGGDSDFTVVFLGETSQSFTPGHFDYALLAGANTVLRGFSGDFIGKIYGLNDEESKELVETQSNSIIIKINEGKIEMPRNSNCKKEDYIININIVGSKSKGFPLIDEVGLSLKLRRLEAEAALDPYYCTAYQMMYVTRGGARIQIVGLNGSRVLDEVVEEGHLIFVPKYFLAAFVACNQGLEFLCVSTSPRAMSIPIAGKGSAYKALSSSALEAAFNVSPELLKSFNSN